MSFKGQIHDGRWLYAPDLYKLVTSWAFRAEVKALYGEYIFKICPTLLEDFQDFYEAFPTFAMQIPVKWLFPSRYRSREKMINNFRQWLYCRRENSYLEGDNLSDAEYNDKWGTQYIQRMIDRHENLGFSENGLASVMLGYFFLTFANTLPAALWMILHILLEKDLIFRVRAELNRISNNFNELNTAKLLHSPLLNALYCETLRLNVGSTIGRTAMHSKYRIDEGQSWEVDPGVPIMSNSWLGGLSNSIWKTGYTFSKEILEHPLEKFWAERFLEYPDDAIDGRQDRKSGTPTADDDQHACFTAPASKGYWFPFGGGASRCPGEVLAKQTILTCVALVFMNLEIELHDPSEAIKTKSNHKTFPFGSHAFDSVIPIHVRRKSEFIREMK
ncbi:hypothetical protein ACMFMG_012053 [Clarireedia jacksonii]